MSDQLYTVKSLAAEQHLSEDTIYDWLKTGDLVGFKLGQRWHIHPADWAAFIDRRRNPPAA